MYSLSFIKEAIVNVIHNDVAIIDGSLGTVKQLRRKLRANKSIKY